MKRIILLLALSCALINPVKAQNVYYTTQDSLIFTQVMAQAERVRPTDYMFFARHFVSSPYVAHTLEVCDPERVVINLREFDCTTFVETVLVFWLTYNSSAKDFSNFAHYIEKIRYKDGKNKGYTSRLHYFSQWIEDNAQWGLVKERTALCRNTQQQRISLSYMSDNPHKYKILADNPSFVRDIRKYEREWEGRTARYIPKSALLQSKTALPCIEEGDIVIFITNKKGLDTSHLGFAAWHKDGKLHLLNASSKRGKVVDEAQPLYHYLKNNKSVIGIRVLKVLK